ncbi:MAG: phosphodiester glycosidase family protein [Pseudomonadota bacterium]
MIRLAIAVSVLTMWSDATQAVTCAEVIFDGADYTICEVDPRTDELTLFLRDDAGEVFGQFARIDRSLQTEGKALAFAMNAGMYHDDRAPVGHYVEDGVEVQRVIPNAGPGNFGLLPNGVLCLRPGRAEVIETLRYVEQNPQCDHATQSGPMLVIGGALHPRFLPDGTSKFIRNGVGTSEDGTRAVFAISDEPVNFHSFGRLFRDHLKVPNALYFDGKVSRLYAPELGRSDFGFALGPIIGVVAPLE